MTAATTYTSARRNGTTPNVAYSASPPQGAHCSTAHERDILDGSAINRKVYARRGYWTAVSHDVLADYGHPNENHPATMIPVWNVHRRIAFTLARPDVPRLDKNGRPIKYHQPDGTQSVIDVPPSVHDNGKLADPSLTLYVTEGIKKADAAVSAGLVCIALLGVTNWRGKNALGGIVALPDWNAIALNDSRPVRLTFDSDSASNPHVLAELLKLGSFLASKGAAVEVVVLPPGPNGEKVGLDDWFAAKHTPAELDALAQPLDAFAKRARLTIHNATRADLVHVLSDLGYTFRLNEVTGLIEVCGETLSDELDAKILSDMADCGYEREKRITNAYKAHAYDNRYHPIKDYLSGLEWDGKPTIARLATYIEDVHDPIFDETTGATVSLFELYLRRWLVGAVAKVFAVEDAQNPALTLAGDQDLGKSALAAWLGSGMPAYYCEGAVDPHNKDDRLKLASYWLWEIGEIDATTSKADVSALKGFITTREITDRPPYGRHPKRQRVICSLIGTVNSDGAGFLHDTTGNRRFLVVTLKHINWAYKDIDVNQLWAEAVALYHNGYPWRLLPDEAARQRAENTAYEPDDPIEAVLLKHCTIDTTYADKAKEHPDWFTPSVDLLGLLRGRGWHPSKALAMLLSKTAQRIGLRKDRASVGGTQVPGYYGIRHAGDLGDL